MKIAVVHGLTAGGALRWCLETTVRLSRDFEIEVFEVNYADEPEAPWPPEVPVRRWLVEPVRRPVRAGLHEIRRLRRWVSTQRRVAAELDAESFDLVLAHPCRVTQAPALISMTRHDVVYFMQEIRRRSYEPGYQGPASGPAPRRAVASALRSARDAPARRIDRRGVARSAVLLANSEFTAETVLRVYGRQATPCLLGVDTATFDLPTVEVPREHLLLVGGLEPSKGALLLLESMGRIAPTSRPPLVITGQRQWSPFIDAVREAARRWRVDIDVRFNVDESELVHLYRSALATCCVARLEPLGLTALESVACGTPVVAVHEGGYVEAVSDGVNGILVDRAAYPLAEGLEEVMARHWRRTQVRASILPFFDLKAATDRLSTHLRQAVASR
jgi:glycosyltransferase involved in cell wall biosynthesis